MCGYSRAAHEGVRQGVSEGNRSEDRTVLQVTGSSFDRPALVIPLKAQYSDKLFNQKWGSVSRSVVPLAAFIRRRLSAAFRRSSMIERYLYTHELSNRSRPHVVEDHTPGPYYCTILIIFGYLGRLHLDTAFLQSCRCYVNSQFFNCVTATKHF